jgi:hypothetical protein
MNNFFSGLPPSLTGGAAPAPAAQPAKPVMIPKVVLDAPPEQAVGGGGKRGGKGGGSRQPAPGKKRKGGR